MGKISLTFGEFATSAATVNCLKVNKWATTWQNQQSECAPSKDSDQPGHPPSLIRVFAVHMKKLWVLSYPLNAQWRLWSDWTDAQADLGLRLAHSHFVGFVMSRLILHFPPTRKGCKCLWGPFNFVTFVTSLYTLITYSLRVSSIVKYVYIDRLEITDFFCISRPSCSKLTTSLVNVTLKFQTYYT